MSGRPEKILADRMRDPKSWASPYQLQRVYDPLQGFDKIVMDDEAAIMATKLSHLPPRDMVKMLDVALPTSDRMWIEWSLGAVMGERERFAIAEGEDWDHISYAPESRFGVRIIRYAEHLITLTCIETDRLMKVMEWPIGYRVSLHPEVKLRKQDFSQVEFAVREGSVDLIQQTAALWGYHKGTPGLSALKHRAFASITPKYLGLVNERDTVNAVLRELSGLTRLVVASLSMLNTKAIAIGEAARPKGRYLSGSKTLPYVERRVAVLDIPKRVSKHYEYVRREINDEANRIRHRRHKVASHYRHSDHLPINGNGWVKCTCPDRPEGMWHKEIHEHWRGDESLGVIEREFTLVRGHILSSDKSS